MADTAPVLVWMSGTDKLCNYFNKVWLDFTGRTFEQENGNGWAEGVHPDDLQHCLAIYTSSFDARKPFQMEYRLKHFDDQYRYLLDNGTPRFLENGEFVGYIGSCIDITYQKEIQQEFEKVLLEQKIILENSNIGFSKVVNRNLIWVNKKTCEMFQYSEEELEDDTTRKLYTSDEAYQELGKNAYPVLAQGKTYETIQTLIRKDETLIFVKYNGKAVDPYDLSKGTIWILEDVTERKKAEQAIKESEEKYRILFDTMTEGVALNEMIFNNSGEMIDYRIIEVNQAFYSTADYSSTFVVGNLASKLYGMSLEIINGFWKNHKDRTEPQYTEFFSHLNNKWFFVSTSLFINNKFVTILFDITNLKQTEKALRKSEERYKKDEIIGKVGNWEYNIQTTTFWGSDEAKRIYGFNPEKHVFSNEEVEKCIPERERVHQALIDLTQEGKEYNLEFEIQPRNSKETKFIWSIAEVQKDNDGNPLIVSGVIQDITDRKRKEEKFAQLNKQLQELNATKDKFFSIVAHDLKGPIGSFYAFLDMITTTNFPTEQLQENLGILKKSAQSTASLLESLLTWARSQRGEIPYNPSNNNLNELIESNVQLFLSSAEKKKVNLRSELEKNIDSYFDNNLINAVIRNLINNALKYTKANDSITISVYEREDEIEVSVKDSGIGMSNSVLEKLFRIDTKQHSVEGIDGEKGTGLGLILCKEFIEKHGGRIWAKSELGKGSEFLFALPINKT